MRNEKLNCLLVSEVCQRTRLSKPTIYKLIRQNNFPKQLKISPHRVVWLESEIDEWLHSHSVARGG